MDKLDNLTLSYAIDFGTSNTVISRWNSVNQQPEIITLPGLSGKLADNPPIIPSLVYVQDAQTPQLFLGQQVKDQGLDLRHSPRYFAGFKRGIGASIQGFLPELDSIPISFEKLGQWYLQGILANLQQQTPENPSCLVLTVPVDSFESYRRWLSGVCQTWSVEQIKIIDEPTAAALGYGATTEDLVLVIDFGGGTVDFSLVKLDNPQTNQGLLLKWGSQLISQNTPKKAKLAKVLAKAGKNLGGIDLDNWLVDYFVEKQGLTSSSLVNRLCERLKIQLSTQENATEVYFDDQSFTTYELSLDQGTFNHILQEREFFSQLDELLTQVLQQGKRNGIDKDNIGAVLLVGGTVKIPAVQNWIAQYFTPAQIRCDRPLEAIALGALQLTQGRELRDFLYHSYGIRYWDRRKQAHNWHALINSGQPYPMDQPLELLLGASWDNQPSVELVIGELGSEIGATEVYFQGDRLVTRSLTPGQTQVQPLNDQEGAKTIARLEPPGNPGSDRLKVLFWVDEQRYLRITVEDLLTEAVLLSNQIVAELR
ncbi:MAG: Hsp70 family protein [Gloeocapsa sp. DLM2.Bin57]|nr:MAG: Hsp70 family protein [Gloeocapsa sp. DLM2.Bin57]